MQKSLFIGVSLFLVICLGGCNDAKSSLASSTPISGGSAKFPSSPTATISNAPRPQATATPSLVKSEFVTAAIERTNLYRKQNDCPSLRESSLLNQAALNHSIDMAKRNYFDHNSPDGETPWDRMHAVGYQFASAAENIAAGYKTAESVIDAFFNETPPNDGHRKNILNCSLQEVGIGYYYQSGTKYGTYWTQDFGTPR
jgi:uncharacterized protein YkwD